MLTKEEFKKEYIRMMDSVRNDRGKGSTDCYGVNCDDCILNAICNKDSANTYLAFETIETVEQWSKDHPIKTNAQVFKDVFGFEPYPPACIFPSSCSECKYTLSCMKGFWADEYKSLEEVEK